jgi:hypothetical protein
LVRAHRRTVSSVTPNASATAATSMVYSFTRCNVRPHVRVVTSDLHYAPDALRCASCNRRTTHYSTVTWPTSGS